ncbi:hypothetical protein LCGC14_0679890 [marine sediment metagenome]|uniref:Uncharacterized protein n=1 Tax=marine sediment metagenome TaxID=412755 RepID=A0A0F9T9Z5_9ZZZZ
MAKRIPTHIKVRNIVQRRRDRLNRVAKYKLGVGYNRNRKGGNLYKAKVDALDWVLDVFDAEAKVTPEQK